ncbi:MAG: M50 family metallopeptidase [Eubacteriales bacterium]
MIFLYFLLTIFLLGILILVHEGGHFLLARANGIKVEEFAIGMGPKILTRVSKKSGIRYSVRLFPIGGFVSMAGEDEESDNPDAFCNKSVWRRMLTILAGPLTNILVGMLCMLILVCGSENLASTTVAQFSEGSVSSAWLEVGDRITSVGGVSVHTGNELVYEIMNSGYEPVKVTVVRDGEKLTLEGVEFPTFTDSGATFGEADFIPYAEAKNFGTIIKHSFFRSLSTIKMIWDSLVDMISGRYGLEAVSGPIGITETVGEVAKQGGMNLLYLFVVLAMNLGVVNLLPFPALDGGRFVFLLIEGIIGRPINRKVEAYVNAAGLFILLALMVFIGFKDIFTLIRSH